MMMLLMVVSLMNAVVSPSVLIPTTLNVTNESQCLLTPVTGQSLFLVAARHADATSYQADRGEASATVGHHVI